MAIKNMSKDPAAAWGTFNSQKYSPPEIKNNNFVDISDEYANSGMNLMFYHVPSENHVFFKAFITAYNETFSSDYASEQVFGRIDPIHTFKQTTRNCTLSFVLPASTPSEAFDNMLRVDELRSFLYPSYAGSSNALTINQSPLTRIRVMNLLTDSRDPLHYDHLFGTATMPSRTGALTVINNMTVNFNLEADIGVFETRGSEAFGYPLSRRGILPKLIEISLDFSIIHEKNLGYIANEGRSRAYGFTRTSPADQRRLEEDRAGASSAEHSQEDVDSFTFGTDEDVERALDAQEAAAAEATRAGRIAAWNQAIQPRHTLERVAYDSANSELTSEELEATTAFQFGPAMTEERTSLVDQYQTELGEEDVGTFSFGD